VKFVEIKPNVKKVSFFYLIVFIVLSAFLTIFLIPIYPILFWNAEMNALVFLLVALLLILIFFFNKILEAYSLSVTLDDKFVEKKVGIYRIKRIKMPIERIEAYTVQKNFIDLLLGLESLQITSSNPSEREDIIIKNVEPESLSEFLTLLDGLIKKLE
jgi:uncharacterized membrane protein YdbT with pleckstrin-like domain